MSANLFLAATMFYTKKHELEAEEIPMPVPDYENNCWNCGDYISNVICEDGGLDNDGCPNGYICNQCGKHLGDARKAGLSI